MNRPDLKRARARELATAAQESGIPLGWFEKLYREAKVGSAVVPWADRKANPFAVALLEQALPEQALPNATGAALKIGCGYGDDAEWLAHRGYQVTAFDIAPSAIAECRKRFAKSAVRYEVRDLFAAPETWRNQFQLVWESYTLQVLPRDMRDAAVPLIASWVAPGGHLVFVARLREENESKGSMPWPLTMQEVLAFERHGLSAVRVEIVRDQEESDEVRRVRVLFRK